MSLEKKATAKKRMNKKKWAKYQLSKTKLKSRIYKGSRKIAILNSVKYLLQKMNQKQEEFNPQRWLEWVIINNCYQI